MNAARPGEKGSARSGLSMKSRTRRLVSLAPNVSMILFALGADDLVVGRTQHCLASIRDYLRVWEIAEDAAAARLEYWAALPVIGAWPQADRERVRALQPDMILASAVNMPGGDEMSTLGLDADGFVNFDVRRLADLDRHIHEIGEIVGKREAASGIVAELAAKRAAILAPHSAPARRPKLLFEYCVCIKYHPDPARRFANPTRFVMVGGYLAPELIGLSGGEPLFTQPGDRVAWIGFDAIREADPDIVLAFDCQGCPNAMKHPIATRPRWGELSAFRNDAIYQPTKNIANPNLCYPEALAELTGLIARWDRARRQ